MSVNVLSLKNGLENFCSVIFTVLLLYMRWHISFQDKANSCGNVPFSQGPQVKLS